MRITYDIDKGALNNYNDIFENQIGIGIHM